MYIAHVHCIHVQVRTCNVLITRSMWTCLVNESIEVLEGLRDLVSSLLLLLLNVPLYPNNTSPQLQPLHTHTTHTHTVNTHTHTHSTMYSHSYYVHVCTCTLFITDRTQFAIKSGHLQPHPGLGRRRRQLSLPLLGLKLLFQQTMKLLKGEMKCCRYM